MTNNAGGRFQINALTGEVTVANGELLDFETGRGHSIAVRAQCGKLFSVAAKFNIAVLNVNEFAPTLPTDANATMNRVAENVVAGATVGLTVRSIDPDGTPIRYSLLDDAGGLFFINPTTGVVTVSQDASLINYETAASHTILVQASDGTFTSTASFVISVTNIAPTGLTDADAALNQVLENAATGTFVGIRMIASDPHGGPLNYSLSDDAGGRFRIDSAIGQIFVANGNLLNFEASKRHRITVVVSDGTAPPISRILTIAVLPGNDAPVLIPTTISASAIDEDSPAPTGIAGQPVSAYIRLSSTTGVRVTDEDARAVTGMAITGFDSMYGMWFFSTNNGTTWNRFPALSDTAALLLPADIDTKIYFQPFPNLNGNLPSVLTFRAWDLTQGTHWTLADTSSNGGSTAFSTEKATVSLIVTPRNDAPVAVEDNFTVNEGDLWTGSVLDNDRDIDRDPLTTVLVTGTIYGELTFTSNGSFTYRPTSNLNEPDSFTYKLNDGAADSNIVSVTITRIKYRDAVRSDLVRSKSERNDAQAVLDNLLTHPEMTSPETVTERREFDFSSLIQVGTYPVRWTTRFELLGSVTFVGDRGISIGDDGIACSYQPDGGTGFAILFNDQVVKVISARFVLSGRGSIGTARGGIAFGGRLSLAETVEVGGRELDQFDWDQNSGEVSLKSLTIEVTVTKKPTPTPAYMTTVQEQRDNVVVLDRKIDALIGKLRATYQLAGDEDQKELFRVGLTLFAEIDAATRSWRIDGPNRRNNLFVRSELLTHLSSRLRKSLTDTETELTTSVATEFSAAELRELQLDLSNVAVQLMVSTEEWEDANAIPENHTTFLPEDIDHIKFAEIASNFIQVSDDGMLPLAADRFVGTSDSVKTLHLPSFGSNSIIGFSNDDRPVFFDSVTLQIAAISYPIRRRIVPEIQLLAADKSRFVIATKTGLHVQTAMGEATEISLPFVPGRLALSPDGIYALVAPTTHVFFEQGVYAREVTNRNSYFNNNSPPNGNGTLIDLITGQTREIPLIGGWILPHFIDTHTVAFTRGKQVCLLDTTTGTERHPLTVPELGESISEFAIDSTGTLFATSDGSDLYLTRTESEQTETKYVAAYVDIASPVTALNFAAGDTVLLVGTKTGLTVLDLTTPRPQQLEQFSIGEVSAIRETSDGYVLVQRPDGILRYAMQNLLPPTCRQTAGASTEPTHEESVEQEVVVSFSDLRRTNPVLPLSSTPAYSYSATKVYETDLFGRVERTEWSYVQPGNEGTVTYTFLDGPRYVSSIQFARSTAPQMYRGASVTLAGQFFPLQLIASDESTQSIGVNSLVSSMTIRMPTGYHPQPPTQFIFPIDVELLGTTQTLTRHVLDNATPLDGSMFETGLSYSSFFDHTVTSGSVIRMSDSIQVQVGNAGGQDIAVHDGVLQPVSGLGGLKLQSLLGPLQVTSVQVIRSNSQGRVYLLASIGEFGLPAIDVTSGGEFDLDEKIETLELVTQDGAAAGFGTIRAHLTPGDGKELRDSDTIISSPLSLLTAGLRRGVVTLAHPQLGRMSIFAGSGGFTVRSGGTVHAGGGSDREEWNHPDSLTIRFLDAPAKLLALDLARNDWTWFGNYQGRNMSGVKITGFLNGVEQFSRYDFIPGRKMAAGIIDTLIVETSSAGRSVLLANLIAEITEERIVSVGAPADPAPQMPPIPTDDGYVPQNYWTPPASAEPIQNPLNPSISGARKAIELLNQKPQKQLSQEQSTTHRHNLSVILQSEGLGSPEERAAGYIAANPDAVLVLKAFSTGLQAIIIQMLQDRSVAQISEDTAARVHDEAIELLRALLNVDVGIGGDGTSPIPLDTPTMLNVAAVVEEVARANSANPGAALRKSLSWFRDSAGSPTIFGFDTNRIAGRILVGVYQATLDVTTEAAIEKFATVEYLTGILTAEMLRAWRKPSTFRSALLRLADRNHYDVLQASTNNITYPVRVDADKQSYTNQYMRVTINPPIMNSSLTHFRAYLYSVDHTTPYREITAGNVVGRLFTDVAVELFGQQTVQGSIKAAVWYFGNTIGYGGFSPHSVTVQWDGTCQSASNDFSTTPADTPANQTRRASENEILRQVIAHFQKQLNDGTWHWTIGSPFHQSADYYALDLNRSSNDYGLDLFAIGEGTITQVGTGENRDLSLGEVRISHTVIVPGQGEKTWIERHYHLPLEQRIVLRADGSEVTEVHVVIRQDENVSVHEEMALLRNENSILTDRQIQDLYDQMNPVRKNGDKNREWAISEGMHADPSSPMGAVGKNGGKDKNGKFILVGAHDHLSILADGKTIDPRLIIEELVESHEMSAITVYDDRNIETKVIWRSDLEWNGVKGLWWSEELHAALDRSDQINGADVNGTSAFWIAWHADPNQRERLTWRKVKLTDDSGVQQEKFAWIGTTAIGQTRRWNDQQWIFLLQ